MPSDDKEDDDFDQKNGDDLNRRGDSKAQQKWNRDRPLYPLLAKVGGNIGIQRQAEEVGTDTEKKEERDALKKEERDAEKEKIHYHWTSYYVSNWREGCGTRQRVWDLAQEARLLASCR